MSRKNRGVSAPLGIVLLFAIVITGMLVTVALGATALEETKDQLGTERAEKVLTQFDSKSSIVALGNTQSQGVSLSASGTAAYKLENTGWMNVTIDNTTSGAVYKVTNVTLGAVVYENGDTELGYQGGGVWKQTESGTAMVSPPEFHFRNATLTLPIVTVGGTQSISERVSVTGNGTTSIRYPNETVNGNFSNPLQNGKVNVTVHSEYYEAWGAYFEQRTDGNVSYDHDNKEATIILTVPAGKTTVSSAIASTAPGGTLSITGSGSDTTRTDSYTSGDGDGYDTAENSPPGGTYAGNITFAGDVDVGGNACVIGSIRSGGSVSVRGAGCSGVSDKITGDVFYRNSPPSSSDVGGDIVRINGVETKSAVNTIIDSEVDSIRSNPDSDADISSSDELDFSDDKTLPAGSYYLERFEVPATETLTLDTGGGPINIAVEEYASISGAVNVIGDGQVKIYVKGKNTASCSGGGGPSNCHFNVSGQYNVVNDNATQNWVYGKSNFKGKVRNPSVSAKFTGVIYAPSGGGGSGEVFVGKGAVYGGLVAPSVSISQGGEFHYDRALRNKQAVPEDESVVRITYLHISVNRVNVTSP